jgi:hypothetical protein
MSILAKAAGKAAASKPKKDAKPEVSDPALDPLIDQIIKSNADAKTAESLQRQAEDQLAAAVAPKRLEFCRDNRRVESSVRINGRLTFIVQNRYSKVDQNHRELVAETYGEQDFGRFFKETYHVELTEGAAQDEAFVEKLVAAIGEEEFLRRFVVRRDLEVTEAFHNALTLEADVEEKSRPLIDAGIVKPAKPSTRQ